MNDTDFGILPVYWQDAAEWQRGSGTLSVTWFDGKPVLTMAIKEGEPLLVQTGTYGEHNATCGDSFHTYFFTIPQQILAILA